MASNKHTPNQTTSKLTKYTVVYWNFKIEVKENIILS